MPDTSDKTEQADQPKVVTQADLDALAANLSKRFEKQMAKMFEGVKAKQTEDSTGDNQGASGDKSNDRDPKLARLEQRMLQLENENKQYKEKLQEQEKKAKQSRAESEVRHALSGKLRPEALDLAIDVLRQRGAIAFDDDGGTVIRVGSGKDSSDFDVEEGVERLLKSKDFAVFIPAPNAGGSGAPTRSNGRASEGWKSKSQDNWDENDVQSAFQAAVAQNARTLA